MHVHAERLTGLQQTAELWNAPRHSLRSCPRRDLIGSAAAERYPLEGMHGGLNGVQQRSAAGSSKTSSSSDYHRLSSGQWSCKADVASEFSGRNSGGVPIPWNCVSDCRSRSAADVLWLNGRSQNDN